MPELAHALETVLDDEERLDSLEERIARIRSEVAELRAVVAGLLDEGV